MKKIVIGIIFCALFMLLQEESNAQIIGKKMPVATKVYTAEIMQYDSLLGAIVEYRFELLDRVGEFDPVDFQNMDNSVRQKEKIAVFDPKIGDWRLAETYNEAFGIGSGKSDPLPRLVVKLNDVQPLLRHKVK